MIMMTKKKPCNKLCTNCQHYCSHYYPNEYTENVGHSEIYPKLPLKDVCLYHTKEETNCVNGKTITKAAPCFNYNKDGCCQHYKEIKFTTICKLLEKYLQDESIKPDCFMRPTVEGILAADLLQVLKGNPSDYFEIIWDEDTPFGLKVVVTKSAIRNSLWSRKEALEEGKNIKDSSCYIKEVTEDEYKKEMSWINKMWKKLKGVK